MIEAGGFVEFMGPDESEVSKFGFGWKLWHLYKDLADSSLFVGNVRLHICYLLLRDSKFWMCLYDMLKKIYPFECVLIIDSGRASQSAMRCRLLQKL